MKRHSKDFAKYHADLVSYIDPFEEAHIAEIMEEIKRLTDELPTSEKGEILESLEQKSPKGRRNYVKRLLDNANVELTVNA